MNLRHTLAALGFIAASAAALGGCSVLRGPSKVADGKLYQSGDGRYDGYFAAVHQEQVAAEAWPDEARASKKPVVTALGVKADASNRTIVSAARSKRGDASVGSAVSQTTASERGRARRLEAAASRLDAMKKKGEELEEETEKDRANMGAQKADDKAVAKRREVAREMSAAVDEVGSMARAARRGASEAEELAKDLEEAWSGKADAPAKRDKRDEKREEKREVRSEKKSEKKAAPPAQPAPPAPKPKPAGEVFTP